MIRHLTSGHVSVFTPLDKVHKCTVGGLYACNLDVSCRIGRVTSAHMDISRH